MEEQKEEELSPQQSLKLIGKMLDKVQDDNLWKVAKKRAAFKMYFMVFAVVNLFLIGVWYATSGPQSYFWPGWSIFGWGIAVLFQYIDAYWSNSIFSDEKEFEKLKRNAKKSLDKE